MRFSHFTTAIVISLFPFLAYAIDEKETTPTLTPDIEIVLVNKPQIITKQIDDTKVATEIPSAALEKPNASDEKEPEQSVTDDEKSSETEQETVPVKNYIGQIETITAKFEDTLLELGREHNLGYVEIVAANPGVDPWLPGEGKKITIPSMHLLPHGIERTGIVINLAEMRLYDFTADENNPKTYPLGIGREGLNTPLGITKIVRKKDGPSWRPTSRMRKENPELPAVVPPGEDNPLGTHALYLGWPQYLIHGTHKPLGVGRRVSSGCIRMYPEDITKVFADIPVGTQVNVIKQPVKIAWIDDMLYLEAHAEDELADSYEDIGTIKEYRVPDTLFADLSDIAGDAKDRLDWKKIRIAIKKRDGLPTPILLDALPEDPIDITEDVLNEDPFDEKPKRAPRLQLNGESFVLIFMSAA